MTYRRGNIRNERTPAASAREWNAQRGAVRVGTSPCMSVRPQKRCASELRVERSILDIEQRIPFPSMPEGLVATRPAIDRLNIQSW